MGFERFSWQICAAIPTTAQADRERIAAGASRAYKCGDRCHPKLEKLVPMFLNPSSVAAPSSSYSHGVLMGAQSKRLIVSGQVGVRPDGSIAEGIQAQTEQAIDNLFNVIAAAQMKVTDIVKITTFLTSADDLAGMREVRSAKFGAHAPASTLLIVAGLANPKFLIEIEAEAVVEIPR